jgi:hypothetical protein
VSSLVLIETSANQRFVFSSNKLVHVVGGSELLAEATTSVVFAVLNRLRLNSTPWLDDPVKRKVALLAPLNTEADVAVVLATSGKTLLAVRGSENESNERARQIIAAVTRHAIDEAPGLDICGVWEVVDLNDEASISRALTTVHQRIGRIRGQRSSVLARSPRRPIIAGCRAMPGPASKRVKGPDDREELLSTAAITRRSAASDARSRFRSLAGANAKWSMMNAIDQIDQDDSEARIAVIHVDSNGLGTAMAEPALLADQGEPVLDALRAFGAAVDVCAATALRESFGALSDFTFVPILAGGDDTTLVCSGSQAFGFINTFLHTFENATVNDPDVGARLGRRAAALNGGATTGAIPLTACGAVVWTKSSYPLSLSMALATELVGWAKSHASQLDFPTSAWCYHDIHDSVALDLASVKDELTLPSGELLTNQPVYVRGTHPSWNTANNSVTQRTHDLLTQRVNACLGAHRGTGTLTTAQLYRLREALFFGANAANAELKLVEKKCGPQPILHADTNSLFHGTHNPVSPLLDAITIARNLV